MVMTSFERIEAAVRLEKPDRIPVVPIIDMFAARYAGITQHQMMCDIGLADWSLQKTADDLGRFDGFSLSYAGMAKTLDFMIPNPPKIPGINGVPDDAELMWVEEPVMQPEEYDDMRRMGGLLWSVKKMRETHPRLRRYSRLATEGLSVLASQLKIARSARAWRRRNVEPFVAANLVFTPMEWMSLMLRGFNDFLFDMFRHPEEIRKASNSLKRTLWTFGMMGVKVSGVKRVFIGCARTGPAVISKKQFEDLAWPELKETAEYFIRRGVTPVLHLDTDWTGFFPYLRELPARTCILNLDGSSDMYEARNVLGDRMCIMGDVPATLLKLGQPEEVHEYCRKLIKDFGSDGGFILSSGCSVPLDAKPENVSAMLRSVEGA